MEVITQYVNPKKGTSMKSLNNTVVFTRMIEYLDDLCENVDLSLDRMRGSQAQNEVVLKNRGLLGDSPGAMKYRLGGDGGSSKPQNFFSTKVNNSEVNFRRKI